MLDELMFYPIMKSRSNKKYYLLNLLCKDTIFLFRDSRKLVQTNLTI